MIAEIYNLKEQKPIEYSKKVCVFGDDDFVMCVDKESGKVLSSGYSIESKLLNNGNIMAPIMNMNMNMNSDTNTDEQDEFSTIYQNLAIPVGLSYINYPNRRGQDPDLAEASDRYTFKETLSDDVFDRLFELIQAPTKRSNNKSRKQEPMTLVGLEGGSAKKKRKYTRKNKQ